MDLTQDERFVNAGLTATALEEFPRPKALLAPQVTPGDVQDVLTSLTIRPAVQAEPRAVVSLSANQVDLRYNLIGVGPTTRGEVPVGRVWEPAKCAIHWGVSSDWGSLPTALVPAAAGAAASIADRNTAAAVAQMPTLFFKTTPTAEFGAAVRRSVEMLSREDTNCVRFIWRLAALYVGTRICEEMSGGAAGGVQLGCGDPVDIRYIDQVAGFTAMLSDDSVRDVIPYKVNVSTHREAASVCVLALAASDRWQWPQTGLSSVLRHMPPLNRPFMAVFGDQANVQVGGLMCSAQIWSVANAWVNGYSDTKLLLEAVEAITTLLYSPDGSGPVWQTDAVRLALPVSRMRALILGPLTAKYAAWEEAAPSLEEPQLKQMILRGTTTSLLLSLGIRHASMLQGTALLASSRGDEFRHLFMGQQYSSRRAGVPIVAAAGKVLNALGVEGHVGRILLRLGMPEATCSTVCDWWRASGTAPQWEEALQHLQALPAGSALYGMFHPLKTVQLMQPSWWYVAGKVPGGLTPCEAVRGLSSYLPTADIKFAYETFNFATRNVVRVPVVEELSYRGVPGDWHVMPNLLTHGMRVTTAFNVSTASACAQAYVGPQSRGEVKWFLEKTTFNTQDVVCPEDLVPAVPPPPLPFVTATFTAPQSPPPVALPKSPKLRITPSSSGPSSPKSPHGSASVTVEQVIYDPVAVAPQRMKLAGYLNVVAAVLQPTGARDWWSGLAPIMTAVAPSDMEAQSGHQGAIRKLMDGWVQTPVMSTITTAKPAVRAAFAKAMREVGRYCASRPLSAVEVHHAKTNTSLWAAAYSSMAIDPAITKDEVLHALTGKAHPDAVAAALGMLDTSLLIEAGDNVKLAVLTLADKMTTRGEIDPEKAEAATRAKEAMERSAKEAHDAMIAEHEASIREAVESGTIGHRELVADILGYLPKWAADVHWTEDDSSDTEEVPHDPQGMGDTPKEILHDPSVAAAQVLADGTPATSYAATDAGIAGSEGMQPDFGGRGATTSASQGALPTPSQEELTGTAQSSIVDFE